VPPKSQETAMKVWLMLAAVLVVAGCGGVPIIPLI
jgi:hypothetical protein